MFLYFTEFPALLLVQGYIQPRSSLCNQVRFSGLKVFSGKGVTVRSAGSELQGMMKLSVDPVLCFSCTYDAKFNLSVRLVSG